MIRRNIVRLFAVIIGALALAGARAHAVDYPDKPIKVVVCFAAGGPNDIRARLFGQYLSEKLGQQLIIENRAGAGGNIGTQAYLAAPPDG
jgi:tripartite-type tricarboxylate transporter receptor subunit TctC